jgi:predicted NAD-dependent protein-ADP-ribosyltransferase YbiA (DUF1768 family)
MGADVCEIMFALHYFFESQESLDGIIKNIRDTLKKGGYFIGCCFDGEKVFDALRYIPENGSLTGMDGGSELWKITKRYSATDLTTGAESIGLGIDVEFISIGTENREYLVPFKMLTERMAEIGCELLNAEECKELGLKSSTAMFGDTWEAARASGKQYAMSPAVKQYSFLNRWFIFKRRRDISGVEEEQEAPPRTLADAGVPSPETNVEYAAVTPTEVLEEILAKEEAEASAAKKDLSSYGKQLKTMIEERKKNIVEPITTVAKVETAAKVEEPLPSVEEGVGAAEAFRTLPTEMGKRRSYTITELYQFWHDAAKADRLKIGDPLAARWLDPSAPYPIKDTESDVTYPSLEHYLAAMKYKLASNKPELAESIFGRMGTVHMKIEKQRQAITGAGARATTEAQDQDLLKKERQSILDESTPSAFKKYKAIFDETKWATVKDKVLEEGLKQRWEKDARFRKIVEAVRDKGMILLYYTGNVSGSNLGGVRRPPEGYIDGENKVGKIIMRLAGFRDV